jgi:hypothetical protein
MLRSYRLGSMESNNTTPPNREKTKPAMTHFGREPVMATSSSEPSMAAVTRRREYGELVEEPVAPPG